MLIICGVDEAGRGSMLGPLVVAGVSIEKSKIKKLAELGVRDSKKLTPAARQRLYKKITALADDYVAFKISPRQIDDHVKRHQLNHLEAIAMAKVIKKLHAAVSYVDSCDVNAARFGTKLTELANTGKVMSYHHADSRFLVVSAASIIAKVTRDRAIARLNNGFEVGSGYPSDAKTVRFVRDWFSNHGQMPDFVRKSWAPVKLVIKNYAVA